MVSSASVDFPKIILDRFLGSRYIRLMARKRITVLPAPAAPVEFAPDAEGDEFVVDFGFPATVARTDEESAEHRALESRKGLAAAQAYYAAEAENLVQARRSVDPLRAARVAAAKTV